MIWRQLDSFSEFGPRQSLDCLQIAFGNLVGLDFVNINVYEKFDRTNSMVQKLGPVSFFLRFRILNENV